MASTNKTTHLNLNQWIGTDPVLRSDFNVDNVKLDAAINDRALLRLEHGTLDAAASTIEIDLLSHDLSLYGELQVHLWPKTSASATVTLKVNNGTATTLTTLPAGGLRGLKVELTSLPGGFAGRWTSPGSEESGTFQLANLAPLDIETLTLTGNFQKETSWAVYGVRM